jgi:hypothetical protein
MDYYWFVIDPRDDQEYRFNTIQEVGKFLYDEFDAGETVTVFHSHEK